MLQAQLNHVALYLVYLIQISNSPSPNLSAFYGKSLAYEQAGLNSPTHGPALLTMWSKALPLTARCISGLPEIESQPSIRENGQ